MTNIRVVPATPEALAKIKAWLEVEDTVHRETLPDRRSLESFPKSGRTIRVVLPTPRQANGFQPQAPAIRQACCEIRPPRRRDLELEAVIQEGVRHPQLEEPVIGRAHELVPEVRVEVRARAPVHLVQSGPVFLAPVFPEAQVSFSRAGRVEVEEGQGALRRYSIRKLPGQVPRSLARGKHLA